MNFETQLTQLLPEERIRRNEPMSAHTTFKVGGPADYYLIPTEEEVQPVLELCTKNKIDFTIIGHGSNLLVGDRGIRGAVIELGSAMNEIRIEDDRVYVSAGALLIQTANQAAAAGLTGLEFASGIPGNIGGGLVMNAGAYGGEMKDVVESVTVLAEKGRIRTYNAEEYEGGYRTSRPMREGDVVLHAVLKLQKGNPAEIRAKMEELKQKRISKQPLEYPSAGSTFKRPEGYFAGKLIEDAGLRGYTVGGAQVSEKHCGFVINKGNATASDVRNLMADVAAKVKEQFGVTLEPEVRFLGEF